VFTSRLPRARGIAELPRGAALAEAVTMRPLALAAATLLAGCSLFMHSIEKPKASVRDVSMSSASFGGVTGQLRLDVTNPNGFGVPLSGIDWQLAIGGARAVTGRVELQQTIPARGVAPITTSLTINAGDALAVGSALARGTRDYQVTAKLHFSTAVGQIDVDVTHTGTLGSSAGGLFGLN
jgi:LEA14-like dessication related protein